MGARKRRPVVDTGTLEYWSHVVFDTLELPIVRPPRRVPPSCSFRLRRRRPLSVGPSRRPTSRRRGRRPSSIRLSRCVPSSPSSSSVRPSVLSSPLSLSVFCVLRPLSERPVVRLIITYMPSRSIRQVGIIDIHEI